MSTQRLSRLFRPLVLAGAGLGLFGTVGHVMAQSLADVQTPDTPLVLKAQGSFFVGGEKAEQTRTDLGDLGPGGHITVNQMYVRYMVPQGGEGNVPVVMVHGATFSDEIVWPNFRFGAKPGAPYAESQFPVAAVDELSKQGVPDVSFGGVPTPNPTHKALSDLAGQVNGAVLMGHSQSGAFPLAAALLNPQLPKGSSSSSRVGARRSTATSRSRRWRPFPSWSSSAITATR